MSHTVTIQPSGHTFQVNEDETVLEAGLREGLALPYGCRDGACGSCSARIVSGQVDYRDGNPPGLTERDRVSGKALLCQAFLSGDLTAEVREIGGSENVQVKVLPCRIAHMELLASDVMRLYLKLPVSERLQYLAGQYIDIILRDGRRRGFSIANAPHNDEYLELHVRRVPGGRFTEQVFTALKEKAILRFEGPLGGFYMDEHSERPAILVGGGTGFAPLKAMLEHAIHVGDRRPFHLYWGARHREDLYLNDLATGWARDHDHIRYTPVLSDAAQEDRWQGATGFVHERVCADLPDMSGCEVYMSGPPAMVEAARRDFSNCGLPESQLYFDSFEYSSDTLTALGET